MIMNHHNESRDLLKKQKFQDMGQVNDDVYGVGKLYQSQTNTRTVILIKREVKDHRQFQKYLEIAKEEKEMKFKSAVSLYGYSQKNEGEFVVDKLYLECVYDYLSYNLDQEWKNRKTQGLGFTEDELFYVIEVVLNIIEFNQSNDNHFDIKIDNLLLNQSGFIKYMCSRLMAKKKSSYQRLLENSNDIKDVFLSPKQLESLKYGNESPYHNVTKSLLYSLGLIQLQLATMNSIHDIYDYVKVEINYQEMERLFSILESRYSQNYKQIVQCLLCWDQDQREDLITFQNMVQRLKQNNSIQVANCIRIGQGTQIMENKQTMQTEDKIDDSKHPVQRKTMSKPVYDHLFQDKQKQPEQSNWSQNKQPEQSNWSQSKQPEQSNWSQSKKPEQSNWLQMQDNRFIDQQPNYEQQNMNQSPVKINTQMVNSQQQQIPQINEYQSPVTNNNWNLNQSPVKVNTQMVNSQHQNLMSNHNSNQQQGGFWAGIVHSQQPAGMMNQQPAGMMNQQPAGMMNQQPGVMMNQQPPILTMSQQYQSQQPPAMMNQQQGGFWGNVQQPMMR